MKLAIAAILCLAYALLGPGLARAQSSFPLAGTVWQLDTAGQSYSKVEFKDNQLLRYYTADGKEQIDKIEKPQCKNFKYADIFIADLKKVKLSCFNDLKKGTCWKENGGG